MIPLVGVKVNQPLSIEKKINNLVGKPINAETVENIVELEKRILSTATNECRELTVKDKELLKKLTIYLTQYYEMESNEICKENS